MKYSAELEAAIDTASVISRYLGDQVLAGEEFTVSVWLKDNRYTVWFQVERFIRSNQGNLKVSNSKIVKPSSTYTVDAVYVPVDDALRELRA